jgi:putative DNA primase/helicase
MLEPLTLASLLDCWERVITFQKFDDEGHAVRINCPDRIAQFYLARRGSWQIDPLTGIVNAPLVRLDGTVLNRPGYDSASGLFLHGDLVVSVPEEPTKEDAQIALAFLGLPFREFPFRAEADKAVAITAVLTALERRLLPACPMFGFSAPTPRSGKSKLAAAPAIIATGKAAPASAVSPDKEEFRKSLFSALREGHAIVNLDNIEHALKSADLCKTLTEAEFSDRVLGESRTLHLATNLLWLATGNNLSFRGDLAQRALLCRIDAGMERPEERRFEVADFEAYIRERRADLVEAALTILRAFHVAGCPEQGLVPWGGFDVWSKFIREPLVWAGLADPCLTRDSILAEDPDKELAEEALRQLREHFEDAFTAKQAVEEGNDQIAGGKAWTHPALHDALAAVSGGGKNVDPERFGKWMRTWRDRYVDGIRLVRVGTDGHSKIAKWAVRN